MAAAQVEIGHRDLDINVKPDIMTSNDIHSPSGDSGVGVSTVTSPSSESTTPIGETDSALQTPNGTAGPPELPLDPPSEETAPVKTEEIPKAEPGRNGTVVSHMKGPDELLPARDIKTSNRTEPVRLRLGEKGYLAEKPISIISVLRDTASKKPNHPAMAIKKDGSWVKWTYKQYYEDSRTVAKGFIKLGLEPLNAVGIIGFNTPQWFLSDLGAIFAGGLATGVYTTNTPEACHYVLDNSDANIVVVENDQQLQKILKVRDRLPHLKAIIQWDGKLKEKYENCYTWDELMEMGRQGDEEALEARIRNQAPNKCCTLIYTSGTTGNPKGVMLSHDNYTWTAKACIIDAGLVFGQDVVISYLPLSHVAAQVLDIHLPMRTGATVYFAQPDALKGSLGTTLKEVRPTAFLGVPRVWEKMEETMKEIGKNNSGLKKKIATWAKGVGYQGSISKMNNASMPWGWTVANALVFKKVRAALGLDRCPYTFTAAAPISRETLEFFYSLDLQLLDLYGMSESTGPHSLSMPNKFKIHSVGTEMPGASTKLDKPNAEGEGEVCMNGRHVCMGYLNMAEKTEETIDESGWLHTGDLGKKDEDGFLFITGRIKELIITAGGENVAPIPIEDIVKEELPVISNCMLIGDKKKFLSMLITIKTEVNQDTMVPSEKLSRPALDWCASVGSKVTTVTEILQTRDPKFLQAIQEGIDRANNRSVSRAQKIQKWSILPTDFSIPGGELGPTLKLKRPVVSKQYKDTIEAFYV